MHSTCGVWPDREKVVLVVMERSTTQSESLGMRNESVSQSQLWELTYFFAIFFPLLIAQTVKKRHACIFFAAIIHRIPRTERQS